MEHEANQSDPPLPYVPDHALVDRYIASECTGGECARIEAWIAANPDEGSALLVLRQRAKQPWTSLITVDAERGRQQLWERLGLHQPAGEHARKGHGPPLGRMTQRFAQRPLLKWISGAMVAVALLAIFAISTVRRSPIGTPSHTYRTAAGQIATVTLGDGSQITLAPQSALTVAPGFGRENRRVALVGEAYFDIGHHAGVPFVVHAGAVATRVTGTTFDVRHYAGDRAVRVAVVTGKVVTGRTAASSVVLVAGTVGTVRDSAVVVTTADDITREVSWRQGTLVFRDTPLPDVLGTLGRWYGIELRVADSALMDRHVSGTLAGTSRAEALSALRALLNVDMTFDETPDHTPVITLVRQAVTPTRGRERRDRRNYSYPSAEVGR